MNPKESRKKTAVKQTLVSKLVEILAELGPVEKSKRNPHFGYNYVSEGQIMAELRHRLSSRNVFLFTSVETCHPQYGDGKVGTYVSVTTKHTFVDADTGEQFVVGGAGLGWDSSDKGVYKAITGAMKYALMKNFLVTDEMEPETGDQAPAPKPAGAAGHRRTKQYEEETGEDDKRVATDLLELKAFLTEHKIPDGFLLRLLQEKKLIDGHTKNVAQLKPGVLRRVLSPKSLDNLVKAWTLQQQDDDSGSAEPPALAPTPSTPAKKEDERSPFDRDEVRTKEGDQTRNDLRQPVTDDIDPKEMLEQEGYDNWREVEIHFGEHKGKLLGKLPQKSLAWWIANYTPKPYKGTWNGNDLVLDAALCLASEELGGKQ